MLLNAYLNNAWVVIEIMQKRAKLKSNSFDLRFSANSKISISHKLNEMSLIYQVIQ